MSAHRYVEEINLAAMLAIEHVAHMPMPSMNKATHSGFVAQRRHYQKSKTRVSVAPQKDICPTNIFKKECSF